MRHLFHSWQDVAQRIRKATSILLFLDFDGTLASIVESPGCARLPMETRRVLRRLAHNPRVRPIIISGRGHDDLVSRVSISCLTCLGSHGLGNSALDPPTRRILKLAKGELEKVLNGTPGLFLEDKGATFALHYRAADAAVIELADRVLRQIADKPGSGVRVLDGDHAWEVLPRQLPDKGDAVRKQTKTFPSALPIYAGNDGTDEPAFLALHRGITIHVGPERNSHARFRLQDPFEVRRFLDRLEKEIL